MHRDGLRFENSHDFGERHRVVVDVLHHLIAEAKRKITVGEWDAIIRFVYTMQPFFDSGTRDVALVPIIVAMPPIDDVDAMNVVAPVQQYSIDWPMPQPKSSTRVPRCKGFPGHSRNRKCALIAWRR